MPANDWINTKEAAEILGVTPDHIAYLLRKGLLEGKKIRRDWVTTTAAVLHYKSTNPRPGPKKKPQT